MPSATIRVLLVEDDPDTTNLLEELLSNTKRARFVVMAAATAQFGLDKVKQESFDVVLLDYRLPDGDGLTFLKNLLDMHLKIPVIFITSYGDRQTQEAALELGAVDYLEKGSFNSDLLERTCLYAIGLTQKQKQNGNNSPGVGMLIEQLVDLTREAVQAQTTAASEVREFRKELGGGLKGLQTDITCLCESNTAEHKELLKEVKSTWTARWVLDWIASHPLVSLIMFLCFITALTVGVLLLKTIDVDKVKGIKDAVSLAPSLVLLRLPKLPRLK